MSQKNGIFSPADILVPKDADMGLWSVIACDQFSSEKEYWERVYKRTEGELSTVHMILPEAYLGETSMEEASAVKNETMRRYLEQGVFKTLGSSFIYVEREVTGGKLRRGLVGKIDLESYDYNKGTDAPVRASENTVISRLPPRVSVRSGAVLELPHVMVLIDDEKKTVIEPLGGITDKLEMVYDFDLMEGGGHIKGWRVSGNDADRVQNALAGFDERPVRIVIGDGNHSLAAAKKCWDNMKTALSEKEREDHPARFALVEMNNVYDEGVEFEPIHRVLFGVDVDELLAFLRKRTEKLQGTGWKIRYSASGREGAIDVPAVSLGGMIGTLQDLLDEYTGGCGGETDYIHDDSAAARLSEEERSIAFFMPAMAKSELFGTVINSGVFPRKSFSIGHARDKRYYLECRKIKKEYQA